MEEENLRQARNTIYANNGRPIIGGRIFGSVSGDGKFRIHLNESLVDVRLSAKGDIATMVTRSDLIKILLVENIISERVDGVEVSVVGKEMDREAMIKYLLLTLFEKNAEDFEKYSDDDLVFVCKWYLSKKLRFYMVKVIEDYLRSTNRLFFEFEGQESSGRAVVSRFASSSLPPVSSISEIKTSSCPSKALDKPQIHLTFSKKEYRNIKDIWLVAKEYGLVEVPYPGSCFNRHLQRIILIKYINKYVNGNEKERKAVKAKLEQRMQYFYEANSHLGG